MGAKTDKSTEKTLAAILTVIIICATALLLTGLLLMLLKLNYYRVFLSTGTMIILASPLIISLGATVLFLKKKQVKMAVVSSALFTVLIVSIIGKLLLA